ncbi:late competence protein ComER [Brevibacillus fulvus]|uniref:Pyrroline-5-carboxylate reductase n=1 Tax=Brevibacillus fulvus TaxID=1125967 RepID=A0A938XZU4_9BACL|nr:late competence protein ComER [Brevibacillus fulvus]MBM7589904.1 competence protein ComER [Brevibacillus fulvus]
MQIGFIGTGSMGSIIIDALLTSRSLQPSQIIAANRTLAKVELLAERHPGLVVAANNDEVVRRAEIVVVCVKPFEYRQALEQFADALTAQHVLITITSPIPLEDLAQLVPCPVVRVVPSITNAALGGMVLCEFGPQATESLRKRIYQLFSALGQPVEVTFSLLRIASDISSCGPAFLSYLLQQMIEAAVVETGISREAATFFTTQMVLGFSKLLEKEIFTLPELEARVVVPAGITGQGLIPLKEHVPGLFHEVFKRTHQKFAEDIEEVKKYLDSMKQT